MCTSLVGEILVSGSSQGYFRGPCGSFTGDVGVGGGSLTMYLAAQGMEVQRCLERVQELKLPRQTP